ncbi:Fatty acid desaturase [Ceratobasidium sp. AG-Ba]|nr:Fatty acid desaturase [Ceratobasidium sp. AG-Ba]
MATIDSSTNVSCSADSHSHHVTNDADIFVPFNWSMKEIKGAIPPHLFIRDTTRGLVYLLRDLVLAAALWRASGCIDPYLGRHTKGTYMLSSSLLELVVPRADFYRIWVIGHEFGSVAMAPSPRLGSSAIRLAMFCIQRYGPPIFLGKYLITGITATMHQWNGMKSSSHEIDWDEIFGDTPIYTLFILIRQQLLAFPAYLLVNVSGQKRYPRFTNHFNPNSIIFNKSHRRAVMLSNAGILVMILAVFWSCQQYGAVSVLKRYGIPWLAVSHWFVMITYLHHTSPHLPHYRNNEWSFQRGAAATIDRDFLGWQGRFFLHDVAHFHVIHHFFPQMPWYNGAEATEHLASFLGNHYMRSSQPVFKELWDTYNECQFVDDEGDVVFYRNKKGESKRRVAS